MISQLDPMITACKHNYYQEKQKSSDQPGPKVTAKEAVQSSNKKMVVVEMVKMVVKMKGRENRKRYRWQLPLFFLC